MTALTLSALLLVAGCSSAAGGQQADYSQDDVRALGRDAAAAGYKEQAAALEDGVVDEAEYEAAVGSVSKCITDAGYAVTPLVLSPVTNSTYEFAYDSSGRDQEQAYKDYDKCEAQFLLPTATVYEATTPQHMDEPLLQAVEECMDEAGTPVQGDPKTFVEVAGTREAQAENARQCTTDLAYKMYPDLRTLSLSS